MVAAAAVMVKEQQLHAFTCALLIAWHGSSQLMLVLQAGDPGPTWQVRALLQQ
jgi:hypothetical protein